MARYRKIDTRMWGDEKFRSLSSPPPPSAQHLWMFLLTGPHTTNLPGLFRAGEMMLAEDLGWPLEGFREGFRELFQQGLVKADWKARVVWIPKAINYNPPDNPNVVKSWRDSWDEVPECSLKTEAYKSFETFLIGFTEGFVKAFREGCGKCFANGLANQEQEQEQEQDIKPLPQTSFADTHEVLSSERKKVGPTDAQTERLYSLYPRKRGKLNATKAIRKAAATVMAGDAEHPAMQLDDALNYLAQRIRLYAQSVQGRDQNFIPYPASWFNAGSFWDDEREWRDKDWRTNAGGFGPRNVDDGYVPVSAQRRRELKEREAAGL